MSDDFEKRAALAAAQIEQQRQEERLRQQADPAVAFETEVKQLVTTFEDTVRSQLQEEMQTLTKTLPPSDKFASDPSEVSLDSHSPFLDHLTQTLEAKKQELRDVLAKDAESAKKVALNYIHSSIESIEIQIAQEHFRLSNLEKKEKDYMTKNSDSIANSVTAIALALVPTSVAIFYLKGWDTGLIATAFFVLAGTFVSFTNPLWTSFIQGYIKSIIKKD